MFCDRRLFALWCVLSLLPSFTERLDSKSRDCDTLQEALDLASETVNKLKFQLTATEQELEDVYADDRYNIDMLWTVRPVLRMMTKERRACKRVTQS